MEEIILVTVIFKKNYKIEGINPNNEHVVHYVSGRNKNEALNLYRKLYPELAVIKIEFDKIFPPEKKKIAFLLSVQPEHACNILNGIKLDELRKKFPLNPICDTVLIYCSKGKNKLLELQDCEQRFKLEKDCDAEELECSCDILNGKIVAKFQIDRVDELECEFHNQDSFAKDSCYEAIHLIDRDVDDPNEYDRYELVSNEVGWTDEETRNNPFLKRCCLSFNQVKKYMRKGKDYAEQLFAIRIKDLVIFDRPLELNKFKSWCDESRIYLTKAPQNYCYVESEF